MAAAAPFFLLLLHATSPGAKAQESGSCLETKVTDFIFSSRYEFVPNKELIVSLDCDGGGTFLMSTRTVRYGGTGCAILARDNAGNACEPVIISGEAPLGYELAKMLIRSPALMAFVVALGCLICFLCWPILAAFCGLCDCGRNVVYRLCRGLNICAKGKNPDDEMAEKISAAVIGALQNPATRTDSASPSPLVTVDKLTEVKEQESSPTSSPRKYLSSSFSKPGPWQLTHYALCSLILVSCIVPVESYTITLPTPSCSLRTFDVETGSLIRHTKHCGSADVYARGLHFTVIPQKNGLMSVLFGSGQQMDCSGEGAYYNPYAGVCVPLLYQFWNGTVDCSDCMFAPAHGSFLCNGTTIEVCPSGSVFFQGTCRSTALKHYSTNCMAHSHKIRNTDPPLFSSIFFLDPARKVLTRRSDTSLPNQHHKVRTSTSPCHTDSSRIVGGITASSEVAGTVVALKLDGRIICSAWIAADGYVVTAAHCLLVSAASRYSVCQGVRVTDLVCHPVTGLLVHERYVSGRYGADLALLEVPGLRIGDCIETRAPSSSYSQCWAAGYGVTSEDGTLSPILAVVSLPKADCVMGPPNTPSSEYVCAFSQEADTCQGDSGGLLFCLDDSGLFTAGVVSHGYGCARGIPGFYTSLNTYKQWLSTQLNDGTFRTADNRAIPTDVYVHAVFLDAQHKPYVTKDAELAAMKTGHTTFLVTAPSDSQVESVFNCLQSNGTICRSFCMFQSGFDTTTRKTVYCRNSTSYVSSYPAMGLSWFANLTLASPYDVGVATSFLRGFLATEIQKSRMQLFLDDGSNHTVVTDLMYRGDYQIGARVFAALPYENGSYIGPRCVTETTSVQGYLHGVTSFRPDGVAFWCQQYDLTETQLYGAIPPSYRSEGDGLFAGTDHPNSIIAQQQGFVATVSASPSLDCSAVKWVHIGSTYDGLHQLSVTSQPFRPSGCDPKAPITPQSSGHWYTSIRNTIVRVDTYPSARDLPPPFYVMEGSSFISLSETPAASKSGLPTKSDSPPFRLTSQMKAVVNDPTQHESLPKLFFAEHEIIVWSAVALAGLSIVCFLILVYYRYVSYRLRQSTIRSLASLAPMHAKVRAALFGFWQGKDASSILLPSGTIRKGLPVPSDVEFEVIMEHLGVDRKTGEPMHAKSASVSRKLILTCVIYAFCLFAPIIATIVMDGCKISTETCGYQYTAHVPMKKFDYKMSEHDLHFSEEFADLGCKYREVTDNCTEELMLKMDPIFEPFFYEAEDTVVLEPVCKKGKCACELAPASFGGNVVMGEYVTGQYQCKGKLHHEGYVVLSASLTTEYQFQRAGMNVDYHECERLGVTPFMDPVHGCRDVNAHPLQVEKNLRTVPVQEKPYTCDTQAAAGGPYGVMCDGTTQTWSCCGDNATAAQKQNRCNDNCPNRLYQWARHPNTNVVYYGFVQDSTAHGRVLACFYQGHGWCTMSSGRERTEHLSADFSFLGNDLPRHLAFEQSPHRGNGRIYEAEVVSSETSGGQIVMPAVTSHFRPVPGVSLAELYDLEYHDNAYATLTKSKHADCNCHVELSYSSSRFVNGPKAMDKERQGTYRVDFSWQTIGSRAYPRAVMEYPIRNGHLTASAKFGIEYRSLSAVSIKDGFHLHPDLSHCKFRASGESDTFCSISYSSNLSFVAEVTPSSFGVILSPSSFVVKPGNMVEVLHATSSEGTPNVTLRFSHDGVFLSDLLIERVTYVQADTEITHETQSGDEVHYRPVVRTSRTTANTVGYSFLGISVAAVVIVALAFLTHDFKGDAIMRKVLDAPDTFGVESKPSASSPRGHALPMLLLCAVLVAVPVLSLVNVTLDCQLYTTLKTAAPQCSDTNDLTFQRLPEASPTVIKPTESHCGSYFRCTYAVTLDFDFTHPEHSLLMECCGVQSAIDYRFVSSYMIVSPRRSVSVFASGVSSAKTDRGCDVKIDPAAYHTTLLELEVISKGARLCRSYANAEECFLADAPLGRKRTVYMLDGRYFDYCPSPCFYLSEGEITTVNHTCNEDRMSVDLMSVQTLSGVTVAKAADGYRLSWDPVDPYQLKTIQPLTLVANARAAITSMALISCELSVMNLNSYCTLSVRWASRVQAVTVSVLGTLEYYVPGHILLTPFSDRTEHNVTVMPRHKEVKSVWLSIRDGDKNREVVTSVVRYVALPTIATRRSYNLPTVEQMVYAHDSKTAVGLLSLSAVTILLMVSCFCYDARKQYKERQLVGLMRAKLSTQAASKCVCGFQILLVIAFAAALGMGAYFLYEMLSSVSRSVSDVVGVPGDIVEGVEGLFKYKSAPHHHYQEVTYGRLSRGGDLYRHVPYAECLQKAAGYAFTVVGDNCIVYGMDALGSFRLVDQPGAVTYMEAAVSASLISTPDVYLLLLWLLLAFVLRQHLSPRAMYRGRGGNSRGGGRGGGGGRQNGRGGNGGGGRQILPPPAPRPKGPDEVSIKHATLNREEYEMRVMRHVLASSEGFRKARVWGGFYPANRSGHGAVLLTFFVEDTKLRLLSQLGEIQLTNTPNLTEVEGFICRPDEQQEGLYLDPLTAYPVAKLKTVKKAPRAGRVVEIESDAFFEKFGFRCFFNNTYGDSAVQFAAMFTEIPVCMVRFFRVSKRGHFADFAQLRNHQQFTILGCMTAEDGSLPNMPYNYIRTLTSSNEVRAAYFARWDVQGNPRHPHGQTGIKGVCQTTTCSCTGTQCECSQELTFQAVTARDFESFVLKAAQARHERDLRCGGNAARARAAEVLAQSTRDFEHVADQTRDAKVLDNAKTLSKLLDGDSS